MAVTITGSMTSLTRTPAILEIADKKLQNGCAVHRQRLASEDGMETAAWYAMNQAVWTDVTKLARLSSTRML